MRKKRILSVGLMLMIIIVLRVETASDSESFPAKKEEAENKMDQKGKDSKKSAPTSDGKKELKKRIHDDKKKIKEIKHGEKKTKKKLMKLQRQLEKKPSQEKKKEILLKVREHLSLTLMRMERLDTIVKEVQLSELSEKQKEALVLKAHKAKQICTANKDKAEDIIKKYEPSQEGSTATQTPQDKNGETKQTPKTQHKKSEASGGSSGEDSGAHKHLKDEH